ncbi:type II secretion system F family protein [Geomonas sp. Red69]|uniref:Type II secretion system F family protein n=1 Tax=Geomonas diazotrophica TaxID=2843197 RepID=A0ABX8JL29_9BACT|nr:MULTISPECIES: type II secretion system F family protein [Geomonas]MBU5636423.1 type II secretion system F family protein [Geomonas diazotrophica]QWV99083.1 type II secretion system F family protein [Geomonas nitrogeniifigens]QXE88251.1 type II secretion system F family protein [Geomonas nitrogeniifigens]
MVLAITAAVFIAIVLLTVAAIYPYLSRRSVVQGRLDKFEVQEVSKVELVSETPKWYDQLGQLGRSLKLSPKEQGKYTKLLVAAGYKRESLFVFFGCKILLAVLLPGAFVVLYVMAKGLELNRMMLLVTIMLVIVGYLAPSYWLMRQYNERKLKIFHTLPDILDLLTVCVDAGLSMDAALIKTTEVPQFAKDPLAMEIKVASMETRAGKPRIESLKDMAERTMVDDVKSFVTMLAQTERFGTSLSQALTVHADTLRTKRRQLAEEAAAKTTIKMIFPLILFVFPALLVVILGPAYVQISKTLFK